MWCDVLNSLPLRTELYYWHCCVKKTKCDSISKQWIRKSHLHWIIVFIINRLVGRRALRIWPSTLSYPLGTEPWPNCFRSEWDRISLVSFLSWEESTGLRSNTKDSRSILHPTAFYHEACWGLLGTTDGLNGIILQSCYPGDAQLREPKVGCLLRSPDTLYSTVCRVWCDKVLGSPTHTVWELH